MGRPTKRSLVGGAAGLTAALLAGSRAGSDSGRRDSAADSTGRRSTPRTSRLFWCVPGEPITLRYAIVCPPRDDGEPCDGSGDVFARAGDSGAFSRFPLRRGDDSKDGRYFVELPPEIAAARDGFSYYAVLRDDASGATVTVPAGGEAAPQRSLRVDKATEVTLAKHEFGHTRKADERVVAAVWGGDVGEVGLSGSRELGLAGPSAFDVSRRRRGRAARRCQRTRRALVARTRDRDAARHQRRALGHRASNLTERSTCSSRPRSRRPSRAC